MALGLDFDSDLDLGIDLDFGTDFDFESDGLLKQLPIVLGVWLGLLAFSNDNWAV